MFAAMVQMASDKGALKQITPKQLSIKHGAYTNIASS